MNWWLIVDVIGWLVTFALAVTVGLALFHAATRNRKEDNTP